MGTPLFIFDLDDTLADIDHRRRLILPRTGKKPDWEAFFQACDKDLPKYRVIQTLDLLIMGGAEIYIFSGRSETVRDKTVAWLKEFVGIDFTNDPRLVMRPANDYTLDKELKLSWLESMVEEDRTRFVAVFDDCKRVVDMWRRNGVTCFQVDEGDF